MNLQNFINAKVDAKEKLFDKALIVMQSLRDNFKEQFFA
jgi:hypothetical protein